MLTNYDIAINLPNLLTALRFLLTPFFLSFFYLLFVFPGKLFFEISSLVFFLLICATDILDGYTARKGGIITDFGASFDLAADFFFRFSSLILFSFLKIIPFWLFLIYLVFFLSFILNYKIKWNNLNKITDQNFATRVGQPACRQAGNVPPIYSNGIYFSHKKIKMRNRFGINMFGKITPVIYNTFIGMIVLNNFSSIAVLTPHVVMLISLILSILTFIAILEGLFFSKAEIHG